MGRQRMGVKEPETEGIDKLLYKKSRIRELQHQLERQSSKERFLLLLLLFKMRDISGLGEQAGR